MRGTILSINTDGTTRLEEVTDPRILQVLKRIVGGHIEIVPGWDRIVIGEGTRSCVVFCNEEGKLHDLEANPRATFMWYECLGQPTDDVLVGNVAVVWGDEEFMREI